MRLIDADALQEEYVRLSGRELSLINDAPTVDAVEVVRCKDCEYWECNDCKNDNHGYCPISENDYCSRGERKDEID